MNNNYHFIPNNQFIRPFPHQNHIQYIPMPKFGKTQNISKITFSGILNGASKTLGVINQAIPVFYQIKPIWNNARTMFKVVKGLNKDDTREIKKQNQSINQSKKEHINAPIFFD